MKEDEHIDNIFLKGLAGKSIEKPASYWKGVSTHIWRGISRPWWATSTALIIGITAVIIVVVIGWYKLNQSSSPVPMKPRQGESIMTDTVATTKDTVEEPSPQTEPVDTDPSPEVTPTEQTEEIKSVEKEAPSEAPGQQNSAPSIDSQERSTTQDKDSVAVTQPDSVRLNPVDSIPTPKIKQPQPNDTSKKKPTTVIILQDTVIVTDTVKIKKKQ